MSNILFRSLIALFVMAQVYGPYAGETFLEYDFEAGQTYISADIDSNAPCVELFENENLAEWPLLPDSGIIEYDIPDKKEIFYYDKREGNRLLGVKGIKKFHTVGSDIRKGSLRGLTYRDAEIALYHQSPLFGAYSILFGKTGAGFQDLGLMDINVKEIYLRFYAGFLEPRLLSDTREKPGEFGFYFFSVRQSQEKIKDLPPVLNLWLYRVFQDTQAVQINYWTAKGRQSFRFPVSIEWGRPYCFNLHLKVGTVDQGELRVWFDGQPVLKQHHLDFSNNKNVNSVSLVRNSITGTRIVGPVVFDEISASTAFPGKIPAAPQIVRVDPDRGLFHIEGPLDSIAHPFCHWMISKNNTWLAPDYNSGIMPFNSLSRGLSWDLQPATQYYLRIRTLNNYYTWSPWSTPCKFMSADRPIPAGSSGPRIARMYFSSRLHGRETTELEKDRWYYFHIVIDDTARWDSLGYVHTWIHARSYFLGNRHNRGGLIDKQYNYIINFDFDTMLYVRDTITKKSQRVMGKKYDCVDDRKNIFLTNFLDRKLAAKFRLSPKAEIGPWFVSAYANYNDDSESGVFRKIILVVEKKGLNALQISGMVLLFLLGLGIILAFYFKRRNKEAVPKTSQEKLCQKGIQYIHENFGKIQSTREIAESVGLSDGYFRKIFKEYRNQRLIDYLVHYRIEKAKQLIRESHLNITEIMFQVGFKNPSHFAATFKKIVGKTPSQFQNLP